jgi:phosphinothricin acetyltransferase
MPERADPTTATASGTRSGAPVQVRSARKEDAAAIARIHNQGIEERSATFETEPRRLEQVAARIADPRQPVVVAERDGVIVGWAGVSRENNRCTQAGVGEYTIYVDRDARGAGVGVPLLEGVVAQAEELGYWKLVGRIFSTNESSLALARRCGFYEVGLHRRHGRIDGEWMDVLVVERLLGDPDG